METHSFDLSLFDRLRSKRNRLFLHLRKQIGFTRSGYRELGDSKIENDWRRALPISSQQLIEEIIQRSQFSELRLKLSLESWQKNLATLWTLEQFPELKLLNPGGLLLEAGAHDFQRAPALSAFFSRCQVHGIELDLYRILHGFHSRADKAQYFSSLAPNSSIEAGDFFRYRSKVAAELIFAFFPFVSPHPAIAWGIPSQYGNAGAWLNAIDRNLQGNGLAFVMHQGKWEEEEFDEALAANPGILKLVRRQIVECPFYSLPHPPHASLYARASS